mgnify:CR=1 FL=1
MRLAPAAIERGGAAPKRALAYPELAGLPPRLREAIASLLQRVGHAAEMSRSWHGQNQPWVHPNASVSIDRGLLERSRNVVVLPTACAWDDVGTWASLRRVRDLDDTGNGVMGHVHCVDASGNVIHADGGCVVAYGISGMLVVSLDGLTFVTTLERASDLAPLLNALPGSLRSTPGRPTTS